ncbi:MAG: hypothetical protein NTV01_08980, partial [Bacteroidia bacterium]|nr:hypothetical protein [Bacteroidia bacterium]
ISQLAEYGILHDRGHADEYYKLLFKYDNKRAEELIQKIGFINDSIKKMFYQSAFNYYFIEKGNFTSALELYKKAKLANVTLEGRYLSWRLLLNGEKKEALLRVKDEFSAGPEDEMNMANYFLMLWVNGYNNEALDFYGKLNNQSIIINILLDSKILVVNRNKSAVKGGFTAEIESFKQFCKFEKMKLEKTK